MTPVPYPKKLLNDYETVALDLHPHWWHFAEPAFALLGSIVLGILAVAFDWPTFVKWLALGLIVPQLSSSAQAPSRVDLEEIVASPATTLLLAHDGDGTIIGSLTLAVFRTPTGARAWIEDVVVDEAARGQGAGKALVDEAIRLAGELGVRSVDLTSRPSRTASSLRSTIACRSSSIRPRIIRGWTPPLATAGSSWAAGCSSLARMPSRATPCHRS